MRLNIMLLIFSMIIGIIHGADLIAQPPAEKTADNRESSGESKKISWLSNLKAAQRQALTENKPVFIFATAKLSSSCRKIASEIETPAAQEELARWISVYLDVDAHPAETEELGVFMAPSFRIRTPGGVLAASTDGSLSINDLVSWLKKQHDAALAGAEGALS